MAVVIALKLQISFCHRIRDKTQHPAAILKMTFSIDESSSCSWNRL